MIEVSRFRAIDLTEEEIARCRELSFGDEGYMCEDLERILDTEQKWLYRYSQVILITLDGYIIAWSLLEPVYRKRRWTAHFFVDPAHRRQGYGTMLLINANDISKRPYCFVDNENEEFFNRYAEYCVDYQEMSG